MRQVKKLLAVGVSLPTAVKELLSPMTLTEFAEKHGRTKQSISNVINGNSKATNADIAALVEEFGGTAHAWRMLLWENAKPAVGVAS